MSDDFVDKEAELPSPEAMRPAGKMDGATLWKSIGKPQLVLAPMIGHSILPWRILCRRHGVKLCYSGMLRAIASGRPFSIVGETKESCLRTCPEDRPLFVQIYGNDPRTMLQAGMKVAHLCDAVDVNLGCSMGIAKKGNFGAFLQEDWSLISSIVSTLHANLPVPVTCKIRLLPAPEEAARYARMLEASGCQVLCVHARKRNRKGHKNDPDWSAVRAIREAVSIPVIANGGISTAADVRSCLAATGCVAVMGGVALIRDPGALGREPEEFDAKVWNSADLRACDIVAEFLEIAAEHPVPFRLLRNRTLSVVGGMGARCVLNRGLVEAMSIESLLVAVQRIRNFIEGALGKAKGLTRESSQRSDT